MAKRKPRPLALDLVDAFDDRVRDGLLAPGDKLPTEAQIMAEFGVSRTVVREALSKLQAGGLVQTRHGIGTFVLSSGGMTAFRLNGPEQVGTLLDVVAVIELRLGVESETAALAAQRRSEGELEVMRDAQAEFWRALSRGGDTVLPDLALHMQIARSTHNRHFADLLSQLGAMLIPRSRIDTTRIGDESRREYLKRVHAEHESILSAITNRDPEAARAAMRTHLSNSRDRLRRAQSEAPEQAVAIN